MKKSTIKKIGMGCLLVASLAWMGCNIGGGKPGGESCSEHGECASGQCMQTTGGSSSFGQSRGICAAGQALAGEPNKCSDATFNTYSSCIQRCTQNGHDQPCINGCIDALPAQCRTCLTQVANCLEQQGCTLGDGACCTNETNGCLNVTEQPGAKPAPAPAPAPSGICSPTELRRFEQCYELCANSDEDCKMNCVTDNLHRACISCYAEAARCIQNTCNDSSSASCCPTERRICFGQ